MDRDSMTSSFTVPTNPWLPDTNDYINEIYDIFSDYWIMLDDGRRSAIDTIDQWRRESTKRIKTYANEQKCLINNDYGRLRLVFDEKQKENLERANAYHTAKTVDLFNQLRDACKLMEFQVAKLEFFQHEMTYPKVIIVEEKTVRNNQEKINSDISENGEQHRKSIAADRNTTDNTTSANASSPSKSTSSSSKEIRTRQKSKTKSKKKNPQPTGSTDDSGDIVSNGMDSNNKCPICYMIFPSNMTHASRFQHVNEHYTDD